MKTHISEEPVIIVCLQEGRIPLFYQKGGECVWNKNSICHPD